MVLVVGTADVLLLVNAARDVLGGKVEVLLAATVDEPNEVLLDEADDGAEGATFDEDDIMDEEDWAELDTVELAEAVLLALLPAGELESIMLNEALNKDAVELVIGADGFVVSVLELVAAIVELAGIADEVVDSSGVLVDGEGWALLKLIAVDEYDRALVVDSMELLVCELDCAVDVKDKVVDNAPDEVDEVICMLELRVDEGDGIELLLWLEVLADDIVGMIEETEAVDEPDIDVVLGVTTAGAPDIVAEGNMLLVSDHVDIPIDELVDEDMLGIRLELVVVLMPMLLELLVALTPHSARN